MKRRAEYLVRKRDGRREWLRSTKLARSIHRALNVSGVAEEWRALELASTVLTGLRQKFGGHAMISTDALAEAVERVLVATGFPLAATCYAEARAELQRRRSLLRASPDGRPWCAGGSLRSAPLRPEGQIEDTPASAPVNRFRNN